VTESSREPDHDPTISLHVPRLLTSVHDDSVDQKSADLEDPLLSETAVEG
jgi:hypothetical protein